MTATRTARSTDDAATSVLVAGAAAEIAPVARALRALDGVTVTTIDASSPDAVAEAIMSSGVSLVAIVPPLPDLHVVIRRALVRRCDVAVCGPVALSSQQALALDDVARRRDRMLMFDAPHVADGRWAFVRKMTSGARAMWSPRFVRSQRTDASGRASLDELGIYDLQSVLVIADGLPATVSAVAPSPALLSLTMSFSDGRAARVEVSLEEQPRRRDVAVVCDGRSIIIDDYDARSPLQVHAAVRGERARMSEPLLEHGDTSADGRRQRFAETIVGAARSRDLAAANARDFAEAALVWETARASAARGGETLPLPATSPLVQPARPELRLIRGGGRHDGDAAERAAPALRLVASNGSMRRPAPHTPDPAA